MVFKYSAGIANVGSYQVSGRPWITGSTALGVGLEDQISFPAVAKSVTVINDSTVDIRVYFNASGSGNVISGRHYVTLTQDRDSVDMGVRCSSIYIGNAGVTAASYTVFAELTGIGVGEMTTLTGSGLTE